MQAERDKRKINIAGKRLLVASLDSLEICTSRTKVVEFRHVLTT